MRNRIAVLLTCAVTASVAFGGVVLAARPPSSLLQEPAERVDFDWAERLKHWAWQPLGAPAVPAVDATAWPRGPVDRFVLAELEARGFAPAAEASRRSWLRRVSYALGGLPPTPAQLDEFLGDAGDKSYEHVVDRLLSSPRFSETWSRHWLDLVRYVETKGHEFDHRIPNAWRYRDYVLRAVEADLPYDEFLVEHVAGDLLPEPRRNGEANESVLATGFWWFGEEVHSPVDPRKDETDRLANQVEVFGKAFLGLTVSCARCHDHKMDAISQADYYALCGYLLSSSYRQVRFETETQHKQLRRGLDGMRASYEPALRGALSENLRAALLEMPDRVADARQVLAEQAPSRPDLEAWVRFLESAAPEAPEVAAAEPEGELWFDARASEQAPGGWSQDGVVFGLRGSASASASVGRGDEPARLEPGGVLLADSLHRDLQLAPGTQKDAGSRNWIQAGRTLYLHRRPLSSGRLAYLVRGRGRIFAQLESHRLVLGPLHGASVFQFDTKGDWRWEVQELGDYGGALAQIEISPHVEGEGDFAIARVVELVPESDFGARLVASDNPLDGLGDGDVAVHVAGLNEELEGFLRGELLLEWPNALLASRNQAAWEEQLLPWKTAEAELRGSVSYTSATAPGLMDSGTRDEQLLARGSVASPLGAVPRHFLTGLGKAAPQADTLGSGRLQLAHALVDASNPATPRVAVNRIWHHLFGRGIVPSVDDFGVMGEQPSHPDLLDYLARRFMAEGWSRKRLIRELVLSATYRQGSAAPESTRVSDPNRAWLSHAPVRRLTAEALRDGILFSAGSLNEQRFGPSVAVHLIPSLSGRGRPGKSGPLDGDRRRSIYLETRRNFMQPFLQVFDAPLPATTMGRRAVSNVPAQALALLNDPFVIGQAQVFAESLLELAPEVRLDALYLRALARKPSLVEVRAAHAFLSEGEHGQEAWADLAHVIFNTKEFRYLD
ncbi:MAG: hypothetical protein ACI8QC_000267 [Planctomycetota bacterium]|jgi:hypothetical protein